MYDRKAFQYLSGPLVLLVVGYSAWSFVFYYHRGMYAWLLESLVALVYGGGFIVMTPQLFINYRLKSVAHLPWKFFMYKALNTFIDDLFAFIIKVRAAEPSNAVVTPRCGGRWPPELMSPRCAPPKVRLTPLVRRCQRCTGCRAFATTSCSQSSCISDGYTRWAGAVKN